MSFSLPTIDVKTLITERENIRKSWDSDFQENHATFAKNIANEFAQKVIEEFVITSKDSYKRLFHSEKKFVSNLYLEIIDSREAQKIIRLTEAHQQLTPFNEWLTKFSGEQKESDHHYFGETSRGIDREYFKERMAIIGRLAKTNLDAIFSEFTSKPEHKDLHFTVKWYCQAEQLLSSGSDFRDHYLSIQLWFDEKIFPKQVEENKPAAIQKYNNQQRKSQKSCIDRGIRVMMLVLAIGFVIYRMNPSKQP